MEATAPADQLPLKAFAGRLLIIGLIFALAVLAELRGGTPYSHRELGILWALVGASFGMSLVYAYLLKYGRGWGLPKLEIAGDGILVTCLVYFTGGAQSVFGFLFVIWIVHAAVRSGARGAIVTSAGATLAFALVALGPAMGWLPAFEAVPPPPLEALYTTGMHVLAFIGVSFLAHQLAREIKVRGDELFELGELHQRIVDNVPSGLLTVSPSGRVTSFNPEAERITGYESGSILTTPLAKILPELANSNERARGEQRIVSRNGEERVIGYSRSMLLDDQGRDDGFVLIFQDLTHVTEMEERLRLSERLSAVGQLAAGLAHEIRNPLASLSGAIELLASDLPDGDPSSRRLVGIVRRETERLNRLVSDFLTYAGPGPRRREEVALREIFEEIGQLLANGEHARTALELDLPEMLRVIGDPDQLRQVFWNLVLNAAEAEPSDHQVSVSARPASSDPSGSSGAVEILVQDRGKGIPRENLERIFEPFFTTRPRGTGLGLATVHRMVEAQGGTIQLQSAPGEGTRVEVILPGVPPEAIKGPSTAADPAREATWRIS